MSGTKIGPVPGPPPAVKKPYWCEVRAEGMKTHLVSSKICDDLVLSLAGRFSTVRSSAASYVPHFEDGYGAYCTAQPNLRIEAAGLVFDVDAFDVQYYADKLRARHPRTSLSVDQREPFHFVKLHARSWCWVLDLEERDLVVAELDRRTAESKEVYCKWYLGAYGKECKYVK